MPLSLICGLFSLFDLEYIQQLFSMNTVDQAVLTHKSHGKILLIHKI